MKQNIANLVTITFSLAGQLISTNSPSTKLSGLVGPKPPTLLLAFETGALW